MSSDPEVRKAQNYAPYFGIKLAIDHPGETINKGQCSVTSGRS